ncbi:MAG: hypothetical protein PHX00_08285 [Synergistaceae bacterium]|nr:hypothetical protein [Synergistaceae bacterium]
MVSRISSSGIPSDEAIMLTDCTKPMCPTTLPSRLPASNSSSVLPTPCVSITVGPNGERSFTRRARTDRTSLQTPVSAMISVSSTNPGLTPVPSTVTPWAFASPSIAAAVSGAVLHGYVHSSAMVITFVPLPTSSRIYPSVPLMNDDTASSATSASGSGAVAPSVTTTSGKRFRPNSSPSVLPVFSGCESAAPTISTPSFSSRMLAMSDPMLPNPHTTTLIGCIVFPLRKNRPGRTVPDGAGHYHFPST